MHVHVVDDCVRFLVALWQIIIEYMPQTCYTGCSTSPPSPSRASPKSTPATCSPETGHPVIQVLTQVKINQYYIYVLVFCLHTDKGFKVGPLAFFISPPSKPIFLLIYAIESQDLGDTIISRIVCKGLIFKSK